MKKIIGLPYLLLFVFVASASLFQIAQGQNAQDQQFYQKQISEADRLFADFQFDSAVRHLKPVLTCSFDHLRVRSLIKMAEIEINRGDFITGKKYLDEAQQYHISTRKKISLKIKSETERILGVYFLNTGNSNKAIEHLNRSLQISCNERYDSLLISKTNNFIGKAYYLIKDYSKAHRYFKQSYKYLATGNSPEYMAQIHQNLAIINTMRGDLTEASDMFEVSLALISGDKIEQNPNLAQVYLNYGTYSHLTGELGGALEYFNKAENIFTSFYHKDYFKLATVYLNKGAIFILRTDYDKALSYTNMALNIISKNEVLKRQNQAKVMSNLGYIYRKMGNPKKGIHYFQNSLEASTSITEAISAHRNLADCFAGMEKNDLARRHFKEAIDLIRSNYGHLHVELANTLLHKGNFIAGEHPKKGLKHLMEAYHIYKTKAGENRIDLSNCLTSIGRCYIKLNDPEKAVKYYQLALISAVKGFKSLNYHDNPPLILLRGDLSVLSALANKAEVMYAIYKSTGEIKNLDIAHQTYSLTLDLIDKIRSTYLTDESKLLMLQETHNIYFSAMVVAYELYNVHNDRAFLEDAFIIAERSKATLLRSYIQDSRALVAGNLPDSMKRKELELKHQINVFQKLLNDEYTLDNPDNERVVMLERQVFEKTQELEDLIETFRDNYTDYYKLKYSTEKANLKKIQESLNKNQVLLEYSVAEDFFFVFGVTNNEFHVFPVQVGNELNERVQSLMGSMTKEKILFHTMSDYQEFVNTSYRLYQILLSSARHLIQNKELIIVPDGIVGYVPFSILLSSLPDTSRLDYRGLPYLIKNHVISYTNLSTTRYEGKIGKSTGKRLLAVAPVYSDSGSANINHSQELDHLPNTILEANAILSKLKGRVLKGKEATKENFKEMAGDYQILHFAMHANIDDNNPLYSRLLFTPGQGSDGSLCTYELFGLELNARLAVLSACNTGHGKLRRGEGIVSLARGFAYAGIPQVVMTLWEVEDYSSSALMTKLYDFYDQGYNIDMALRSAMVSHINNSTQLKAHPYFWAPFICMNNGKETDRFMLSSLVLSSLTVAFLLLLILIWNKARIRKATRDA